MAFSCKDCSYRGKSSGQAGQCPACGSFNVEITGRKTEQDEPPARWRMVVLVSLWSFLIFLILWKLVN